MNQERPYITDFSSFSELCCKVTDLLETEYKQHLAKKRGIISIHDFDKKIFPGIIEQLQPLSEDENNVVEAMFDTFCGIIVLHGSEMAFEIMRVRFQK